MRDFLNILFRNFRTTKSARRLPPRANLQLEGLEDRLVPTSVSEFRGTAFIGGMADNHRIVIQSDGARHLEVFDNNVLVNNPSFFDIGSINLVTITVSSGDTVVVSDSNGMPFAQGAAINLYGNGA